MVSLAAFFPFKSAQGALENMNAISEGVVHGDLKLFLETNLPLWEEESRVGGFRFQGRSIFTRRVYCVHPDWRGGGRGLHFHSLVKGHTGLAASKAQLGLGHSYSRSKVQHQQSGQHDHPVHCSVGPAGQGHQHFLHACPNVSVQNLWNGH
ncbi:nucleolar protein 56-like isoform X2 [Gymnodraco acuticeps]|nr:nucleolar protein 56-like isoform X2 [Gymnodraco acuticeps]XP_034092545.1 nucleolar protein 56-like isoform X2 [Gymnodraco acuticeps]XP_034092546.1 nucleolar protein 56-like isoform X2 [Gymnodraco acuticeps]